MLSSRSSVRMMRIGVATAKVAALRVVQRRSLTSHATVQRVASGRKGFLRETANTILQWYCIGFVIWTVGELLPVSPELMLTYEAYMMEMYVEKYKNDLLPSDHPVYDTYRRVGRRIEEAALEVAKRNKLSFYTKYSITTWKLTVIESPTFGIAFVGGRHIVVTTEVLQDRSEDEIAVLLAKWAADTMIMEKRHPIPKTVFLFAEFAIRVPFEYIGFHETTRFLVDGLNKAESAVEGLKRREADRISVQIVAEACYDPSAGRPRVVWEKEHKPVWGDDRHIENYDTWTSDAVASMDSRCREIRAMMTRAHAAVESEKK